jgi:hypothetical protein
MVSNHFGAGSSGVANGSNHLGATSAGVANGFEPLGSHVVGASRSNKPSRRGRIITAELHVRPRQREYALATQLVSVYGPPVATVGSHPGMVINLYPEPWAFKPERFLGRKFSHFDYVPYGGGARRCLGAAMASYEMRLVLGTILKRFRLRLASQKPDNGKVRAANVGPVSGVRMTRVGALRSRNNRRAYRRSWVIQALRTWNVVIQEPVNVSPRLGND